MAKKQEINRLISSVIPKRGEIYLVNFDPAIGSEIKKTRPALILQNNIANRYSSFTIVAAITSFSETLQKIEIFFFLGLSMGITDLAMMMSGWMPAIFSHLTACWVGFDFISPII